MQARFDYPVFLNLQGRFCLVVGGGAVALRKTKDLLACGAKVRVVSPQWIEGFQRLARSKKIQWSRRPFHPADLKKSWLVIAATDDAQVQRQVAQEAARKKIWANVVDQPGACSFIVPSVVRRGKLRLAISTGGISPALAQWIRKDLMRHYGPQWGRLLNGMKRMRGKVLRNVAQPSRRKRLFKKALDAYIQTLQERLK